MATESVANRMRPVAVLALAALASAPTVLAESYGSYTIASPPAIGVVCSPSCLFVDGLNVGGFSFWRNAQVPVSVEVSDESEGPVYFSVCQENEDQGCDAWDPEVSVCGTSADLTTSARPFRGDLDTTVTVYAWDDGCPGALATSGTIVLHYR